MFLNKDLLEIQNKSQSENSRLGFIEYVYEE